MTLTKFLSPGAVSTPLDKSMPQKLLLNSILGWETNINCCIAVVTFSGVKPPANSQGEAGWNSSIIFQSKVWPVPPSLSGW